MNLDEIAEEASKLTEEEQAFLVTHLLHGLNTLVYQVPDEEVSRRMQEAEDDASVWLTFDQLATSAAVRSSREKFDAVMAKVPDVEPAESDRLPSE